VGTSFSHLLSVCVVKTKKAAATLLSTPMLVSRGCDEPSRDATQQQHGGLAAAEKLFGVDDAIGISFDGANIATLIQLNRVIQRLW